jgi:hypothetical protein
METPESNPFSARVTDQNQRRYADAVEQKNQNRAGRQRQKNLREAALFSKQDDPGNAKCQHEPDTFEAGALGRNFHLKSRSADLQEWQFDDQVGNEPPLEHRFNGFATHIRECGSIVKPAEVKPAESGKEYRETHNSTGGHGTPSAYEAAQTRSPSEQTPARPKGNRQEFK